MTDHTQFKQGDELTGPSLINDDRDATGIYLRLFDPAGDGLLIERSDGTRDVIATDKARHAKPTAAMFLRGLADHLDHFPEATYVGSVSPSWDTLRVQLYERGKTSAITALLPWLASVGATTASGHHADGIWHLAVRGHIANGLPIEVIALTEAEETAALDAIFDDGKHDAISPEVLTQCQRSAEQASAVTR